jgi:hypothetical protein
MLAVDIKKMNVGELEELLLLNTKEFSVSYDTLENAFGNTLFSYIENNNPMQEEKVLWHNILMGFYGFEDRIVEALSDTMGFFRFVLWCRNQLSKKEEVALFLEFYAKYREQKLSAANTMSTVIDLLIQGLADSDPESISGLLGQLESQLNRLPDFVKEDIDFKAIK